MANVCHKKSAAFLWTLLECMFFSGVVLGWSWLALIFRNDDYFSCNVTVSQPATAEPVREAVGGASIRDRKNCRDRVVSSHSRSARQVNNSLLTSVYIDSLPSPTTTHFLTSSSVASLPVHGAPTISPTPMTVILPSLNRQSATLSLLAKHVTSTSSTVTSSGSTLTSVTSPPGEGTVCLEQREILRRLFAIVAVLRDLLVLPVGAFFDKYGTTRTRLLTVLVFAIGTLMTTFVTDTVPWLMLPALSLTGAAGTAVLLTNLQIANLFGRRRHLVLALYCGASLSSGIITYMMQLSQTMNVNVQTSFMFLTIGLVPLLVSTVAFLPKTRVPWPLPANYGKRRNQSLDENMLRKQRAWQRRLSEAGVVKLRRPVPPFWPESVQHQLLLAGAVVWHGVQALHTADMETRLVDIGNLSDGLSSDLEHVFGWIQLLSLVLAPIPGVIIDRRRPPRLGEPAGTQQMQNLVAVIVVTSCVAVTERVLAMWTAVTCQALSFLLHAAHRVCLLSTTFSFLMHVHFPQEHIGKYVGLTLFGAGLFASLQFPIRLYLYDTDHSSQIVDVILIIASLLSAIHAINVWVCCRRRLIRDQPYRSSDRSALRSAATTSGHAPLAVHIETDDSNLRRDVTNGDVELQAVNSNGGLHVVITEPSEENNEENNDT